MMQHRISGLREVSLCGWFSFWAQFAVLGAAAVLGAFFAGADVEPGDQTCGVILIAAAFLLMFLRIKAWFDSGSTGGTRALLVDDMPNLIAITVVFVVLALSGIFVAAGVPSGGLHSGGVALVLTSALGIFVSLKNVFDVFEHRA